MYDSPYNRSHIPNSMMDYVPLNICTTYSQTFAKVPDGKFSEILWIRLLAEEPIVSLWKTGGRRKTCMMGGKVFFLHIPVEIRPIARYYLHLAVLQLAGHSNWWVLTNNLYSSCDALLEFLFGLVVYVKTAIIHAVILKHHSLLLNWQ